MWRRVFSIGFPHDGFPQDFGLSHHFTGIPTAYGIASAVAAQPRIVTAGERRSFRTLREQPRGYEYGYIMP
jgi:hypothetical protein